MVKALVRGHYDIYPAGQQDYVQNLFALNADLATTPLLGVRILQLPSDVPTREHEGSVIEVGEVVAYFAGMDIENRAVLLWLDAMLKTGLILDYDPTVLAIDHASQVEISPAGKQHLFWAQGNQEYLSAMAEVTPLLVEATFAELMDHRRNDEWRIRAAIFIDYLLREDEMYCVVPRHDAYQSQARVRELLRNQETRFRNWRHDTPFPRRPADVPEDDNSSRRGDERRCGRFMAPGSRPAGSGAQLACLESATRFWFPSVSRGPVPSLSRVRHRWSPSRSFVRWGAPP